MSLLVAYFAPLFFHLFLRLFKQLDHFHHLLAVALLFLLTDGFHRLELLAEAVKFVSQLRDRLIQPCFPLKTLLYDITFNSLHCLTKHTDLTLEALIVL